MDSRFGIITAVLALTALCLTAACSRYPADMRGSLDEAEAEALQVGVSDAPPWIVWNEGEPTGVEAELIRAFAEAEGFEINWIHGTEDTLLHALEAGDLHIVAAGLVKSTPWKKHVTLSGPISVCRAYVALDQPSASRLSTVDIQDLTVRVERAGGLAHLVEKQGAEVDPVKSLEDGTGPAAAEEYRLASLGLVPTGDPLRKSTHVLALPKGENALYAALTRSLPAEPGCLALPEARP